MNVVTFVLYLGHPKKGRPGFFALDEYLSWASTSQKHNGRHRVCSPKYEEESVVNDEIFLNLI